MINPALVIFAIEAGVKLGRKVNEVLVDETAQRALLLPLGDLFGTVTEGDAMRFFNTEGAKLIAPRGPLHPHRNDRPKLVEFYRAMRGVETGFLPAADLQLRRSEVVIQIAALDQFDKDHEAKNPARRIFGTIVEIGIDYVSTHPEAFGKDSAARKIIHSFVAGLQDTDFAEGSGRAILGDLLSSALRTINEGAPILSDDKRLQVLLGGITSAIAEDVRVAIANGDDLSRQQLFRRIGSSLIRGGTAAFSENLGLFLPDETEGRKLVQSTLSQVLVGINDQEDLFSSDSIELIFKSALKATAENATLLTDNKPLQELISGVLGVVADRQWNQLFSSATGAAVLHQALEVTRENIETIIDPKKPSQQLLATGLAALAGSLSAKLAGGGSIQDLLSRAQLLDLTRITFQQIATHPEALIGSAADDPKRTVLAQTIASVARALGDDPSKVTTGAGFIELVKIAVGTVAQNADKLVNTDSASPNTNLLFKILQQVMTAVSDSGNPRNLVTRDVLLEIVRRVLPIASANLEPILRDQPKAIQDAIATALELAEGALANRVNGGNIPGLIEGLLIRTLWNEIDLTEINAVERTARNILRSLPVNPTAAISAIAA